MKWQRLRSASVWTLCLMTLCLPMLAGAQTPIYVEESEPPLMVLLDDCLAELTQLKLESLRELDKLKDDCATELYEATQKAAAEAVRAVMVELAGVEAERDAALLESARRGRIAVVGCAVLGGLTFAFGTGWLLSVLLVR